MNRAENKQRILVQLDSDLQPSVFDAVVAVDAGVNHLFRHGGVTPERVRDLVYGAMFTRGPNHLRDTAIFVGGSDVSVGEQIMNEVTSSFLGPVRVSVLMDSNGANTTAAAAVAGASRHLPLNDSLALVLAGTGPVGQRTAGMLTSVGATVRVASRDGDRSERVCSIIRARNDKAKCEAVQTDSPRRLMDTMDGVNLLITAGAAGVRLVTADQLDSCKHLRVAIDLNAVPPLGIEGIQVTDSAEIRSGIVCYGAIGMGATKMKIHRAAIGKLFERNDIVLDAEEVFQLARELEGS